MRQLDLMQQQGPNETGKGSQINFSKTHHF